MGYGRSSGTPFNPWEFPEDLTLKDYVPPDVLEQLHPHWLEYPPLKPFWYYTFGMVYLFGGAAAVGGNLLVLYIFMKNKSLRSPSNILVMNLAFADFMIMGCLFPECVYSFFSGGIWHFGPLACLVHAFCGALFGYGQITTLIFIAYDRYNVIVRGFSAKPLTYGKVMLMLLFIWAYSLAWSIPPVLGFGGYALDGTMSSCSFDYLNRNPNNVGYIWGCFIFCYCFPLFIIVMCYYHIVKAVFAHEKTLREQAKKMNVTSLRSNDEAQKVSAEIRIAKVAMINISLWVIAWTPFAVICLVGLHGNQKILTPLASSLPIFFAKTSCVYNPIIYAISHPRYRQCLKKQIPWMCIDEQVKSDNQSTVSEVVKCQDNE